MKQNKINLTLILVATINIFWLNKNLAQCDNTAQWPTGPAVSVACGTNTIINNIFAGEFSLTTGYQDQSNLTFSSSVTTDYITLRKASDNALIASGPSPLTIMYLASYGNVEVHINTNVSCGTNFVVTRVSSVNMICGCNNGSKYPSNDIDVVLGVNTLSTIQWAGDYNVTKGYLHEALCTYASSVATDFITLRKVSTNQILASGISPVNLTYDATMGSIEMHINTNASCGTQNSNRTTTLTMSYSIYKGGIDDGFALASIDQGPNPTLTMYRGGIDDGFVSTCIDQGANPVLTMYRGGIDDGFVSTCIDQGANPILTMYRGGIDDGFVSTCIDQGANPVLTIYRGGIDDGFVSTCFDQGANPVLAVYRGGNDDGFTLSCYEQCDGIATRWIGNVNISWHNYQNWECGILPTITSDVIIPSGALLFPTVSTNDEIRSLNLKPGSSIIILPPAVLKLNGL
jgi:hypothetical protein